MQLQMEGSYASLQEEVDVKTKKLKKLWAKLQASKSEISDLHDEFRMEREDLLDTIRELSREQLLKQCIIENFIPIEERQKIEKRAVYDEELEEWTLAPFKSTSLIIKRPLSTSLLHRPTCQYAKAAYGQEDNLRYKGENIINIKLDLPDRTTLDAVALRSGEALRDENGSAKSNSPRRSSSRARN